MRSRRLLVLSTAGVFVALGWLGLAWRQAPIGAGAYRGYNVLFVTIDTLRADHLPAYGYSRVKTPSLDALAAHSLVFRDAQAHVPLTLPSHTSMLTGLLPQHHGIPDNGGFFVSPKLATLPKVLSANGYETAAFVSSFALDSRWGLAPGFGSYYDRFYVPEFRATESALLQRRGGDTEKEVERWLTGRASGKPFFAWAHFYDPHEPYEPPSPYREEYKGHLYDGEIAYVDFVLGRLFAKIVELKLDDRTLIVVTADHGESLGEHGEPTHGVLLYDATLHVPLMVRLPRGRRQDVDALVRHVDLAPTLLDWLGLPPLPDVDGKSLVPLLEGRETGGRSAVAETRYAEIHYGWSPLERLADARYSYVKGARSELFDRRVDRAETRDVTAAHGPVAAEMDAALGASAAARSGAPERAALDADAEEKLNALGYLATAVKSTDASRRVDPRDTIAVHSEVSLAHIALTERRIDDALAILGRLLAKDPDLIEAHYMSGSAHLLKGDYARAVAEFSWVSAAWPENDRVVYNLGTTYHGMGRYEEAETMYRRFLAREHDHIPTLVHLATLCHQTGREAEARSFYLEAARLYESFLSAARDDDARADLLAKLAEVQFRGGRADAARETLDKAIAAAPRRPTLHYNLALVLEDRRDREGAAEAYMRELELSPRNYRALNGLARMLRDLGLVAQAVEALEQSLEVEPGNPEAAYRLAETYLMSGDKLDVAQSLAEGVLKKQPNAIEVRDLLMRIQKKRAARG